MKTLAPLLGALLVATNIQSQGVVTFANPISLNISTNATGIGGTVGATATTPNGFYYGLFIAPSTVSTIDLSLQELFTPTWTFTGDYGTNTALAGRLSGGAPTVPGWQPATFQTYLIVGWSSNMGHDWSTVGNELQGATFNGTGWDDLPGYNGVGTPFIGASLARAGGGGLPFGEAGGSFGTVVYPALSLFGTATTGTGTPALGFTLYTIAPEPSTFALALLGGMLFARAHRKV